ncbi:MAG: sulfatase [Pirellulaceae bacterium]|nr:sulfatase [Pirellulaceae bacterium]
MKLKSPSIGFAFFLVCTVMVSLLLRPASAQDRQPNIVLIISDDQAWTDYSFMGHDEIKTPNLDELAKQSVLFRRGHVPTALCRASLLTMITGRYAHQHGVTGNDPSPKYAKSGSDLYRQRCDTLISFIGKLATIPKLLTAQGYVCFQSGKWWEGGYQQGGFSDGMTRGFPEKGGRHGDDGLQIGRDGLQPVTDFIDKAVADDKPFFCWFAPIMPHTPHNPPPRFLDKRKDSGLPESIAKYHSMCEWFDESCGELIQYIDAKGIADNTLIVYVCDNGWIQNPNSRRYALRSKQTPYEGGVRTPIMFCWPGHLKPADRPELCSSIDLMPTILAAARAEIPQDLPGLNLLPYMEDGKPIPREVIFGETFAHDIADLQNPEASLLFRWCIDGPWKLILTYDGEVNRHAATHPRTEKRPQLFNVVTDPGETNNVAGEHPEIVAALVEKIGDWYPVTERKTITKFE